MAKSAKVAAVILLSLMPFGVSIVFAFVAWQVATGIATVYRLIAVTLVWIATFAAGTQIFWKVTGVLAAKQP